MENKLYLYPYSAKEADRNGEIKLWRESFKENIRCRDAIETAIREHFDGMRLNGDCASSLIQRFGFKRVAFVLANTLQQLRYDGRFSRDNKDWGKTIEGFDTDTSSGEEMLYDQLSESVEEKVVASIMSEQLHRCIAMLSRPEQELINALYFAGKSERQYSTETGIPRKQ